MGLMKMLETEPRLDVEAVRALRKDDRVDFSCMELPPQVKPGLHPEGKNPTEGTASSSTSKWALSGSVVPPPPPPEGAEGGHGMPPPPAPDPRESRGKWGWCLGGRPPPYLGELPAEEKELIMTKSLP